MERCSRKKVCGSFKGTILGMRCKPSQLLEGGGSQRRLGKRSRGICMIEGKLAGVRVHPGQMNR